MRQTIAAPAGLLRRESQGRLLFSQVAVAAGRRMIFVSGQVSRLADGTVVGKGDMRAQIAQVCRNIQAALAAAGASMVDVVEVTTFTTDITEYFRHVDARFDFFGDDPPAMTTVGVAALGSPDFLLEAKAVAVLDD